MEYQDDLIARFLHHYHWKGIFVEAWTVNSDDLKSKLYNANCLNRSAIMCGAVVRSCQYNSVDFIRPPFEERSKIENKTVPHWLRREIGQVLVSNATHDDWVIERVPCYTCVDVLSLAKKQL